MARHSLTTEQRDRIIAKIVRLRRLSIWHPSFSRFNLVADRLQHWLAGVSYRAQWAALYDCVEHSYARNRIGYEEAIARLRWLGIDAKTGIWKFSNQIEIARRYAEASHTPRFDAVSWELRFYQNAANAD